MLCVCREGAKGQFAACRCLLLCGLRGSLFLSRIRSGKKIPLPGRQRYGNVEYIVRD